MGWHSECSEQFAEVITDGDDENEDEESDGLIAYPSRIEVDEAIDTLNRLSLFTEDAGFHSLMSKLTRIIDQRKRDEMRQSWINNLFKQQWMWTCYVVKKILKLVMMLNISVWHLNISDFNNSCVSPFLLFFPKIVLI